jgi:hypothetical protein
MHGQTVRELIFIVVLSFLAVYLTIRAVEHRLAPRDSSAQEIRVKVGTVVTLPMIRSLSGEIIHLKGLQKTGLYIFFSTECPACARSAAYWRVLDQEARRLDIPLYLIGLERELEEVERFIRAYGFDDLIVWYDAFGECRQYLKIPQVPQFLLIDGSGKVLEAWIGAPPPHSDINVKAHET